jgi:hypothetical protein
MCVTYCHRLGVLYWNHEPCSFEFCPFAVEESGQCNSCRHRQAVGAICGLTRAPLPQTGGCCHWNVDPVTGLQPVTPEMLAPLSVGPEPAAEILAGLDAPYEMDVAGQLWVKPGRLGVPDIYGLGTEELPPEALDWSEWEKAWQERAER